jgi:fatty-acyl-CoA synthase
VTDLVSDLTSALGLADVIAGHARRTPHKTALYFAGEDISYRQLWQRIEAATTTLAEHGVRPADRVAWLGLNYPAQLVLLFALARLGAILLPLNYRLAQAEMAAIVAHADVSLIVADAHHRPVADSLLAAHAGASHCKVVDAALFQAQADGVATAQKSMPRNGSSASPVLLVYTSGTTGKPKGALHTQAGLMANCVISGDAHAFTPDDHVLTVLPLFHVGGLCIQTLPALYAGATVTLHARFDAGAWLADVQAHRPSMSVLVPATLRTVMEHPRFADTDLSSLRLLNAGSSTIPASQIAAFHARSVPVCQVYGATETGPVSIYLKREDAMQRAGSAGKAGLNVDVRLVDVNADGLGLSAAGQGAPADAGAAPSRTGHDVAPGAVGEIWIRAPNVMGQYWNDPANPAFQHGWFRTGDLARCDEDGFYWVVGRSKDMIISGGENIYPAEIENVLADCPLILEAAVVGQPDDKWGEVAVAVVVKMPDANLDANGVMALFDGKLARFKRPRRVLFVESLPKTALGKVQKSQLADVAQSTQH